jgi:hypothetical protein
MGTTYVYCTTKVDSDVTLALTKLGPSMLDATLDASSVGKAVSGKQIMSVPRAIDNQMYVLDTSLTIDGIYIASLQLMLRGHGVGSMIWWRWRKAAEEVGYWLTDHVSHGTKIAARGRTYSFTVTGKGTFGYDDVHISLTT